MPSARRVRLKTASDVGKRNTLKTNRAGKPYVGQGVLGVVLDVAAVVRHGDGGRVEVGSVCGLDRPAAQLRRELCPRRRAPAVFLRSCKSAGWRLAFSIGISIQDSTGVGGVVALRRKESRHRLDES